MEINDEMLACYVEGTLDIEKRNFVRKYLSEHPEKLESVLHMMDDFTECCPEEAEENDNAIPINETSFSDIAFSVAAFAPQQRKSNILYTEKHSDNSNDFLNRLNDLCDEIGL